MEYLIILLIIFVLTVIIQKKYAITLFENKTKRNIFWVFVFFIGALWDNVAVILGHWNYPGKGLVGITLWHLPLEDYLFIIVVTYAIIVFYKGLEKIRFRKK